MNNFNVWMIFKDFNGREYLVERDFIKENYIICNPDGEDITIYAGELYCNPGRRFRKLGLTFYRFVEAKVA